MHLLREAITLFMQQIYDRDIYLGRRFVYQRTIPRVRVRRLNSRH